MTPMIDVVFQLLTFFMLTLKTVVIEGDFNIRMPLGGNSIVGQELLDQLATAEATFAAALAGGDSIRLGQARQDKQQVAEQLSQTIQAQILDTLGNDLSQAELTELELDCDPGLTYDHVVSAITAASGIVRGDEVIPLIQKIKFAPPKKAN